MYKVLLIDDSKSDRALLLGSMPESVFKEAEFIEADSLKTASKFLGYRQFDVAILDLFGVAPGSDGAETYYQFQKLFPSLPTMILTGSEDEQLARLLVESGADGYVIKGAMSPQQFYRELFSLIMIARHRPRVPDAAIVAQRVSSISQELKQVRGDSATESMSQSLAANGELNLVLLQKLNELQIDAAGRNERLNGLISDVKELKQHRATAEDLLVEERRSHIEITKAERMAAISLQEINVKKRWQLSFKVAGFVLAPTGLIYVLWKLWVQTH